MDRDDRRRFIIILNVIFDVVAPLFRQRLEKEVKNSGYGSLQDFLNDEQVLHKLFHLSFKNNKCCKDKGNCDTNRKLPMFCDQWNLLYHVKQSKANHNCHCKYTAKYVKLDCLDITLAGLILLNCCNLGSDINVIKRLRQLKNHFSHNLNGSLNKKEYIDLWEEFKENILKLDGSKKDELNQIKNRPDENIIQCQTCYGEVSKENLPVSCQSCCAGYYLSRQIKPYKLGQPIFKLQTELDCGHFEITGAVMMDDGRLVLCFFNTSKLLICTTDGLVKDSIQLKSRPRDVTAVNSSTVAVTLHGVHCVEMYDINKKLNLKSITIPDEYLGPEECLGITTTNNKLIVGCGNRSLLIIDHQTERVEFSINITCVPNKVHAVGKRIFYFESNDHHIQSNTNLYCLSLPDLSVTKTTLPSKPLSITSLKDGSLYVLCEDGSIQHISPDGQHYKLVETEGLNSLNKYSHVCYNPNQRQLLAIPYKREGKCRFFEEI